MWNEYRTEKDAAKEANKPQYDALWNQRTNRMKTREAEVKALWKPKWRGLFKSQRKDMERFDAWMVKRLRYAITQKDMNKGKAVLLSIFSANTDLRIQFEKEKANERKSLGAANKQAIRDAGREVQKAWQYDRDQLRAMHKAADDKRLDEYRTKTDEVWNKDQTTTANDFEEAKQPEKARTGAKRSGVRNKLKNDRKRSRRPRPR
jgi:hypothetical protein